MNDEAGWLIEMKFGDGLLWWSGEFDRAGDDYQRARLIARMVNDAGKAVRFARREDAQRVLDGMFSARPCPIFGNAPTLYSVQEHMWPAPSQPGQQPPQPINMVLHCPKCGEQHIDKADAWWNNPPHRSHLCHGCGHIWRPADVPTNGVAAIKTHGTNDSAIAQPQQATDWRQATTYLQRMSHALSLLCGVTPTDEMIAAYLDTSRDDDRLQHWCADNGPAWAQGIVVIDAARVLADTPAEGADHESAQPQQAAQPVAWRYEDARGHFRYRGYVPNFDVEYATLKPIPLFAAAQPQQKPGSPQ